MKNLFLQNQSAVGSGSRFRPPVSAPFPEEPHFSNSSMMGPPPNQNPLGIRAASGLSQGAFAPYPQDAARSANTPTSVLGSTGKLTLTKHFENRCHS
jgi:hypothetical protein